MHKGGVDLYGRRVAQAEIHPVYIISIALQRHAQVVLIPGT